MPYVFNPISGTLDWTVKSGGDAPIVFNQVSPSAHWHVVHGRGSNPAVVLRRADGQTINGFGSDYPDTNTVDIFLGLPMAGTATLTF